MHCQFFIMSDVCGEFGEQQWEEIGVQSPKYECQWAWQRNYPGGASATGWQLSLSHTHQLLHVKTVGTVTVCSTLLKSP